MDHLTNLTIQVPPDAILTDNGRVLCVPGSLWKDALLIITFYATNYLAHAATVKSSPGDTAKVTACNVILAVLYPMSGLMRALKAIFRLARFSKSELDMACKAGALCMVVRAPD